MGNLCSKASSPDVSSAGRRLGSATAATSTYGGAINVKPPPSAILLSPQKKVPKVAGPGQTLGGPVSGNGGGGMTDAREAAAVAAEAREQAAKAATKKVPLSAAQKRQISNQQILAKRGDRGPSVDEALSWD